MFFFQRKALSEDPSMFQVDQVMRVERMRQAVLQGLNIDAVFAKPMLPLMHGQFGPPGMGPNQGMGMYPPNMNFRGGPPGGPNMRGPPGGGPPGPPMGRGVGRGRGLLGERCSL